MITRPTSLRVHLVQHRRRGASHRDDRRLLEPHALWARRRHNRGYGYSEEQIETNRFRVTFAGNRSTPRNVVENYLLVRAAELSKSRGFNDFVLAKQDVEPTTRYWSSFDNFGGYGYYYHSWPYYGAGMDSGTSYPITRYTAYADILMVRGPKDAEDVRSFSADECWQAGPQRAAAATAIETLRIAATLW